MGSRFKRTRRALRGIALALAGGLLLALQLKASEGSEISSEAASRLFDSDSLAEIGLEAPWRSLSRLRTTRPSASGRAVWARADGTQAVLDVEIRIRGKWRLENCAQPPITLSFSASGTLVHATPQCKPREKHRQYIVQEYLIYRFYEALTEASLETRLAVLETTDSETRKRTWSGHAILIEDIGAAADRLGRRWVESESIRSAALDRRATALFSLFQFMIGNTDWSLLRAAPGERCCHNVALLASGQSETGLVPMPFDFDASGLVNTGDVAPSEFVPISSVRQRFYRGLCAHNPQVGEAVGVMNRARPELEAILDEVDLPPGARRSTLSYIDDFYEIVNDPGKLDKRILARCRS